MTGKEVLQSTGALSEDSIIDILEVLGFVGAGEPVSAAVFPNEYCMNVLIRDPDGREYCVGLGAYGFVEIVREGSPSGRILYMPKD